MIIAIGFVRAFDRGAIWADIFMNHAPALPS